MKLFKTNNTNLIMAFQNHFLFHLPSALSAERPAKFELKFNLFEFNFFVSLIFFASCRCLFATGFR